MKTPQILLLSLFLSGNTFLSAQNFRIGGGLDYNVDVKRTGLFFRGSVTPDSLWRIAGTFNYFFDGGAKTSKYEFAIDGHLFFWEHKRLRSYLIGGVNLYHFRDARTVDENGAPPPPRGNHFGLNMGAGIETKMNDQIYPFTELKVSVGDGSLFGVFVGFTYHLQGKLPKGTLTD